MTPRLRCTVVAAYASLGGSERWLLSILDHTPRLRVRVVLLQEGPMRSLLEERGIEVRVLDVGSRAFDVVRAVRALGADLRRSDPEVVLANGVKAATVAVPGARALGIPVVWAKHDFSFDRSLAPWLARSSDAVVATSGAVAEAAAAGRVTLVPPARPELDRVSRRAAREVWRTWGSPLPEGPVLAMVGRLVAYKGFDTAIRALPDAMDWQLMIVGGADPSEPGEEQRLRELASSLGVSGRVHFVGEVERVDEALGGVDAVAVLTRRSGPFGREGYSLVALEALSAGTPLIGSEGNPEVVRMASVGGYVVPSDDPGAVAAALVRCSATGRAPAGGRALIEAHPDARSVADRVAAVLAEVAGRPGAGLSGPPMSVLTCFRNEAGHVDGVVGAVLGQLGPDDEYLLLDDQSEDGTTDELRDWADRDSRVRLLTGPGINLSAARNHGFTLARHPRVACTDAGVTPAPDWLDQLRSPFAEQARIDLVVGSYDVDGGTPLKDAARLALFPDPEHSRRRTPWRRLRARWFGRTFSADRLDGRSMACRVDAWRDAGGFDESLGSSEDAVFGDEVRRVGGRATLALAARVTWEQADGLRDMAGMYRKYGYWGGRAGATPLVAKDLARLAAAGGVVLIAAGGGRPGRIIAAAGVLARVGEPVVGALGSRASPAVVVRVPVVVLVKDLAKAIGCAHGLVDRARMPRQGRKR